MTIKIGTQKIEELNIFIKNDIRKKEIFDYFKQLIYSLNDVFAENSLNN